MAFNLFGKAKNWGTNIALDWLNETHRIFSQVKVHTEDHNKLESLG